MRAVSQADMAGKAMTRVFSRDDFTYELPPELIAQTPPETRGESRLLVVADGIEHLSFGELPRLLHPGDLLVVNDTRVIKARLMAQKDSGGRAEILLERIENPTTALCQVRVSKPLKPGRTLLADTHTLEVLGREGEFYRLAFPIPVMDLFDELGNVPLPPYITRSAEALDGERYQTIWNREPGAVAAPTAGLHFTRPLLEAIEAAGVRVLPLTLHVGAGTFQPVRFSDLSAHRMHSERYAIGEDLAAAVDSVRERDGRVVAVGTTVVRALESAAAGDGRVAAGAGETDLFITPGYRFRVVDALVTNFHLPESTLLMMVCAFGGYDRVLEAYRTAVACRYRFFSYGDAMFLEREDRRG
jgi:S-adenosylmethionine:tRNA ribosyltransferase-isomerase